MRNFPHQVNRISKIRGSLEIAGELIARDEDIGDDAILGYAVARAGIYTFRDLIDPSATELESRIRQAQQERSSNQGPRTYARDLRRTLILLGFLDDSGNQLLITELGNEILSLPDPPDPSATNVWQKAVLGLQLTDGGVIHPAYNMLRLAEQKPGIDKKWLAFALDMTSDSDEELRRILGLTTRDLPLAIKSVGATRYQADNAVKILPSLLEQLGLLSIDSSACIPTAAGLQALSLPHGQTTATRRSPRQRRLGYAVKSASDIHDLPAALGKLRTSEEQFHSAQLLEERTAAHQNLVKLIINHLQNVEYITCSDDAYDILTKSRIRSELLLIEAKTVRNDGLIQARVALGQLLYYEFFDIQPIAGGMTTLKIVAFDSNPGEQVIEFLTAYDVLTLVIEDGSISVPFILRDYLRQ